MSLNKTVLISGATSGIGLCTAVKLKKIGYKVIALGRDKVKLESLNEKYGIDIVELDISSINEILLKNNMVILMA